MGAILSKITSFGTALPRWVQRTPGLRAIVMPKFGRNAWYNFFLASAFADICNVTLYPLYHIFAWVLFCFIGFCYVVIRTYKISKIVAKLRHHYATPAFSLELQAALYKTAAELPSIMLFLWALFYVSGSHSVWINRITLLVWLNYFAVGCAVALRRGVDDFFRSRNVKRENLSVTQ